MPGRGGSGWARRSTPWWLARRSRLASYIEERPWYTRASIRVTADEGLGSVRGVVGAGQVQPVFLRGLREAGLVPTWLGGPVAPRLVRSGEIADLVENVLGSSERTTPVVVLAPLEEGGYEVPPADLAWELMGRGQLYVLQRHEQTFELTDTVGDRRMSCYWGAARAYLPGWSRHDDPYAHPLLVEGRIADPVMRATWLGELGVWLGSRLELPPSIAECRASRSAAGTRSLAGPRAEVLVDRSATAGPAGTGGTGGTGGDGGPGGAGSAKDGRGVGDAGTSPEMDRASMATRPGATSPAAVSITSAGVAPSPAHPLADDPSSRGSEDLRLEALLLEVKRLGGLVSRLAGEVERLSTISAVRSSSTNAIERRLGRLEDILEEVFPSGRNAGEAVGAAGGSARVAAEPEDDDRATLVEVVHDIAESQSDALVFLESALASAADSPYEDPERVRAILEAMARVARRRRDGLLGTSLREAFADLGIDYRGSIARSTPARLREQHRFTWSKERIEAEEHIVLGNTYDPRRCLRIYFSSRIVSEPRFVIAHVGRHFEVMSST